MRLPSLQMYTLNHWLNSRKSLSQPTKKMRLLNSRCPFLLPLFLSFFQETYFRSRAKLFRFAKESNEWKERGTGDVKFLKHKESGKTRIVMRRDQTLKVCANHYSNPPSPTLYNTADWIQSPQTWFLKRILEVIEAGCIPLYPMSAMAFQPLKPSPSDLEILTVTLLNSPIHTL